MGVFLLSENKQMIILCVILAIVAVVIAIVCAIIFCILSYLRHKTNAKLAEKFMEQHTGEQIPTIRLTGVVLCNTIEPSRDELEKQETSLEKELIEIPPSKGIIRLSRLLRFPFKKDRK